MRCLAVERHTTDGELLGVLPSNENGQYFRRQLADWRDGVVWY